MTTMKIETCPVCHEPAHPTESMNDGTCLGCEIQRQAARIAELEGALDKLIEWDSFMGYHDAPAWVHARRVLGEGGRS